jgi:ribosomal protein S18 acetylase RimI-like enzyme
MNNMNMRRLVRHWARTIKDIGIVNLQKVFWIRICCNFVITDYCQFEVPKARIKCKFIRIDSTNYTRVNEFRKENRVKQFKDKLKNNEIGYFVEYENKIIGSIWATINRSDIPCVAQKFRTLRKFEGAVTDGIVDEEYRGLRIGPLMVAHMFSLLLNEYGIKKIIADVNFRNRSSLLMLEKLKLKKQFMILYVSALGLPIVEFTLKEYAK